ncbi:hypothetical protein GGS24DRAFT_507214 [Hypoxylon argillaceum]|nr:hypothetical protein GGS24DRAFT_507214 [Hypoxylon argillaceum]
MSIIQTYDENPAWRQIIINSVFNLLTIVVVGLRFYSRRLTRAGFGWDDGFTLIATLLVNAMLIAAGFLIDLGFGLPLPDITLTGHEKIMILGHTFRLHFLLCICFVKLSALFFYLRVFGNPLLYTNTVSRPNSIRDDNPPSRFSLSSIRSSLEYFWCFLRTPSMRSAYILFIWVVVIWSIVNIGQELTVCGLGKPMCARQRDTDLSICVFNSVSELMIFLLPLWPIWRLQMNKSAKIGLSILLLLGTVTIVVAFLRFEAIVHTDYDNNYNATAMKSFNYAILEPNLAILCISLPMLQPLFRKARGLYQTDSSNRNPSGFSQNNSTTKSPAKPLPKSAQVNIELTVVSTRASHEDFGGLGASRGIGIADRSENEKRKVSWSRSRDGSLLCKARSLWSIGSYGSSPDVTAELASRPGTRPTAHPDASSRSSEDWPFSPCAGVTITTITAGKT